MIEILLIEFKRYILYSRERNTYFIFYFNSLLDNNKSSLI